jgi:E3 ubiquitin ligase
VSLGSVAVVIAVALVGLAGIFALAGFRDWRLWTVARRVVPVTPDELLRDGGRRTRRLVAVTGTAQPGREGPLESVVNAQPCVWYRYTVHRRRMRHDGSGRSRPSMWRRLVADETSGSTLVVSGTLARIPLQPTGLHIERTDRAPTRTLPGLVTKPFPEDAGMMSPDLYVHREWVIRTGTPLYVLAEAATGPGGIVLRRPSKGPHLVSTRSVQWVCRRALANGVLAFLIAAAAIVAAVLVLVTL